MANCSYSAGNFGTEFSEKFEKYENDYYRPDLDNSNKLVAIMENLDSPSLSPINKIYDNTNCLRAFIREDEEGTNAKNLRDWYSNGKTQFKDEIGGRIDNTSASRDDVFINQYNS